MALDPSKPEEDQAVDLKLVDATSEPKSPRDRPRSTFALSPTQMQSLPVWLIVVTLVLFFLVIGWQAQVASELGVRVAGLEEQLERTNSLLDARRRHLAAIRGGVGELSARLEDLRILVDSEPTAGVLEGSAPTP